MAMMISNILKEDKAKADKVLESLSSQVECITDWLSFEKEMLENFAEFPGLLLDRVFLTVRNERDSSTLEKILSLLFEDTVMVMFDVSVSAKSYVTLMDFFLSFNDFSSEIAKNTVFCTLVGMNCLPSWRLDISELRESFINNPGFYTSYLPLDIMDIVTLCKRKTEKLSQTKSPDNFLSKKDFNLFASNLYVCTLCNYAFGYSGTDEFGRSLSETLYDLPGMIKKHCKPKALLNSGASIKLVELSHILNEVFYNSNEDDYVVIEVEDL